MAHTEILRPVVVLVLWTLLVLVWTVVRRLPALKAAGIDIAKARGGAPGALDGIVPDATQWPAHNYMHLVEQPTLFYAIALTLAVLGWGGGLNATLGWIYVGLRIAHSLIQIIGNRVAVRFLFFALSSLVLLVLAHNAAYVVFHGHG